MINSIDVRNIDELIGKIELIDIREKFEYATGTIETAVNIPMGELLEAPEDYLDMEKTYYLVCQAGRRSLNAAIHLQNQGYKVVNVAGGVSYYKIKRV